jgi:hypothetical protein
MKFEELEKIDPPYFIKGYSPGSPSNMYLNFNELGIDEEGNVYVDPEFEMSPQLVLSSKYDKAAVEKNPFHYFGGPRPPWPKSKDWHLLAVKKYVEDIKVFADDKHFQQLIMKIFGDK